VGDGGTAALDGRVALVTGGSGGIGRALAQRLAGAGCRVGVTFASGASRAADGVAAIEAAGGQAIAVPADLTDPSAGLRAIDAVEDRFGPVDVLASNAGVAVRVADIGEVDAALLERTLAVNLVAPFLQVQRLAPAMAERGFGRILVTSSLAAITGGVVGPHYAASKAALHGLVTWVAARYASRGVTANALAPALIAGTEMLPVAADRPPQPIGRFGTVDEAAGAAMAMLTNGYVTGKVWTLDGGLRIGVG
jgi:3-oxoacyl-[acyl-carrier protein] reductase